MTSGAGARLRFPLIAGFLQIAFIILFAIFADYGSNSDPKSKKHEADQNQYSTFQDVHTMMFIGFGFLMTFLKRYGYSAVGINFLVAALSIQWATLVRGFLHLGENNGRIPVHLGEMLTADFAAATVLISFGACLGKTSPTQLIVMAMIEIVLAQVNEKVGLTKFKVTDAGESMFVHIFGAYFGLAVARVLYRDDIHYGDGEGATYHSDIFAMIGTIFLWLFWPSFNGGALTGGEQQRAFLNTYFSLAACCVVSFIMSWLVDGQFNMVHIQNATLAGGVAIGTAADLLVKPYGALLVGSVAAIISVLGYKFITPALSSKLKIHDTCGVHNLHGMPGIVAALVGAIMAYLAKVTDYGIVMFDKFPGRLPTSEDGDYYESVVADLGNDAAARSALHDSMVAHGNGTARTDTEQALWQLAATGLTLAIAIVGGIITGFILKIPVLFDAPPRKNLFEDHVFWELPAFHPYTAEGGHHHEGHEKGHEGKGAESIPLTSAGGHV